MLQCRYGVHTLRPLVTLALSKRSCFGSDFAAVRLYKIYITGHTRPPTLIWDQKFVLLLYLFQ